MEQVLDSPPQPVITKDNVTMQIDTVIYFQITDPKMYTYGVEHPLTAIEKELRDRLEAKFDTIENGQKADTIALEMVKEVYEPLIKAIDSSYQLYVEFN